MSVDSIWLLTISVSVCEWTPPLLWIEERFTVSFSGKPVFNPVDSVSCPQPAIFHLWWNPWVTCWHFLFRKKAESSSITTVQWPELAVFLCNIIPSLCTLHTERKIFFDKFQHAVNFCLAWWSLGLSWSQLQATSALLFFPLFLALWFSATHFPEMSCSWR